LKVVILCGGKGTRLREETEFKPKPLVDVGGMPIIWHIMKIYSHYGHKEFILPLGYKGDMIKEFFMDLNWRTTDFSLDVKQRKVTLHKNNSHEDWTIHFVDTGLESRTALRLKKVQHLIDGEEFLLTYGDGVSDINIKELIDYHRKERRIGTITGVKVSSRFGVMNTKGSQLIDFEEKPEAPNFINGGFMVFSPEVFDILTDEDLMLEEEKGPIKKLASKGEISVYHHSGFWFAVDTYRDYLKLNEQWTTNPVWKVWA
jgi:glucose-1-phosphate cytidylyltransferase